MTSNHIRVDVNLDLATCPVDAEQLAAGVRHVLEAEAISSAEVSVAVVDDETIHHLNRRDLEHDYPTDVLSYRLDSDGDRLEGEVVVSSDTATREAVEHGWQTTDELLLYIIHGTLHLTGYDDHQPDDQAAMREQEQRHLAHFGLDPHYDENPTGK